MTIYFKEKSSEWQEIQRKIKEETSAARSEAAKGVQQIPHIEGIVKADRNKSSSAKAELIGVSRPAV